MAKEFAFLFYVNDWAGGTQWMTRLQRGAYLDLLLYQVNNTSFSLEEVKIILGDDFDKCWHVLERKFEHENGNFFNKKMREVLESRAKFTESRRENRLGKTKKQVNNTSKSLVKLVGKEREKEKENRKEVVIPELSEFLEVGKFCCQKAKVDFEPLAYSIELKYHAWKADGWKDGHGKQIKNWKTKLGNTLPYLKKMEVKKDTWVG